MPDNVSDIMVIWAALIVAALTLIAVWFVRHRANEAPIQNKNPIDIES